MGKYTDHSAISREALVRRYAALRGISIESAEGVSRGWSRSDLRGILELAERDEAPAGKRADWDRGRTTTVEGLTR